MQLGNTRPSIYLLYTLRKSIVSLDLAILSLQVRGDNDMQGRLAKKDLTKRDNND
jgi:hypothetical protein